MGTAPSKRLWMKSELTGGPKALGALWLSLQPTPEVARSTAAGRPGAAAGGSRACVSHVLCPVEATSRLPPCGKQRQPRPVTLGDGWWPSPHHVLGEGGGGPSRKLRQRSVGPARHPINQRLKQTPAFR